MDHSSGYQFLFKKSLDIKNMQYCTKVGINNSFSGKFKEDSTAIFPINQIRNKLYMHPQLSSSLNIVQVKCSLIPCASSYGYPLGIKKRHFGLYIVVV